MADTAGKDREMRVTAEQRGKSVGKHRGNTGFEFVGGYSWLDFVNTELVERERVVDLLGDVGDLIHWLRESGVVDPEEAGAAFERLEGTAEGDRLFERAKEFRKVLREASERFDGGGSVAPGLVGEINDLLAQRLGHYELAHTPEGFDIRFRALPVQSDGPEMLLVPVAESVARFLADADPHLVKGCENPGCVLFFYDTSKNHTRRWCSMATCGNRVKARTHYERAQGHRQKSNG